MSRAELVHVLAVSRPEVSGPVRCQACAQDVQPDVSWRCPCGEPCLFGVEQRLCLDCGAPAPALRHGYSLRSLCECLMTEEQRAEWEAARRESLAKVRAEQAAVANNGHARRAAALCWTDSGNRCEIALDRLPFSYCGACVRFSGRGRNGVHR